MKPKSILAFAIVAAVLLGAYFANVAYQTHLGEKALEEMGLPHHSLADALAKAKMENKLVLADLSAIWCPSCRSLDRNILSDASVKEAIQEKYIFARIEYESDEGAAFMERYEVSGFPVLLVLDDSGKKLRRLQLASDPQTFAAQL